jgi:heat shock protein HslJ
MPDGRKIGSVIVMRHLLFAVAFLVALTCESNPSGAGRLPDSSSAAAKPTAENLGGTWQLQPVLASDTATGRVPTISFDLTKHTFSGNTGCNEMRGIFRLKGDSLTFTEQIVATKMTCQGYNEKAFLDNLFNTNRYQIKEGVLQLMYNETILSKWVRHADTTTTKQI